MARNQGPEHGGTVRKYRLAGEPEDMLFLPMDFGIVRRLRSEFLSTYRT